MALAHSICLVDVWQWIDKLTAGPADQDALLSGATVPSRWASFGQIWQNALNGNDTLWYVPLSMELMIGADLFHLPGGCMAVK